MLTAYIKNAYRHYLMAGLLGLGLFFCKTGYGQLEIDGDGRSEVQGNSYTYNVTYNGTSAYLYNGPYTWTISGGVITGTSTTVVSGTSTSYLYNIAINVTWSSNGSINFSSNLGNSILWVFVAAPLQPGTLSPSTQTINYGAVATITGTDATGGSVLPSYSYQWQSSADNVNWTNISGATGVSYSPTVYATTYFRRQVTETNSSTIGYTSSVLVNVYPQLLCTISPSSQTITSGSNASTLTSSVSGGSGTYTYQWKSSPDQTTWTNVATTPSYTPTGVTATTYYRLIATSNGANATSNTATVTVSNAPGASLAVTSTTRSGNGSINTLTCTASGGNGTYAYAWYYSINAGSTYQLITGAGAPTYTTGVVTSNTLYYVTVTSNTYSSNSNIVSITMPTAPTISASATTLCNGASATLTASGGSGNYTWYNSSNTQVGTGATYNTTASGTYYATSANTYGISGPSNQVSIAALSTPAVASILGNTSCVLGSSTPLSDATAGGTWSSNNTSVLKIDAGGIASGVSPGTATVTYTVTNTCGTSSQQLGMTVVPLSTYAANLGRGIPDPIITDTISLVAGTIKTTQYQQDTLYSSAHSIKNVMALRVVEETGKYIPGDFSATAVVKVEYGHTPNDIYQVDSTKLTVTFTKNGGNKYNAISYFSFNNAEFTRVTVLRVDAPQTVGGVSFDTKQVLQLTNSLMATRYYQLTDNQKPVLTYTTPSAPVPDELPVTWVYPVHTDNNYTQLEWAWLPNGMNAGYLNAGGVFDTTLLFKYNATRIDLPGGTTAGGYNIPLLYGDTGVLYIRARAMNMMPSGSRSEGPWSGVQTFAFNGHNANLNWQVTTNFAEEGKRKTVIRYFDGSLRPRQTVTKDNSTGTVVVAETMYDAQGRPAVQILPAPGINNIIAYNKNLNKFNSQPDNTSMLDYFDFTTTTQGKYATSPLSSNAGTGLYYSSQNPEMNNTSYNKNIPSTNGYAYAVTRYTPDATGRVMMQSGVGDSMQTGGTHATRYYYGSAAKEELDALFGTEVGNYTHYFKNMVKDANGQMSVSYVDMHGRTVATALAGQSPNALQALAISDTTQYKNQAGKMMTRNLLDKGSNVLKGNSIESINTILVPFSTLYNFNYRLMRDTLKLPTCSGGTVFYVCKFDLQISVSDEAGDTTAYVYTYPGIDTINVQIPITLPVGSYSVRKTLTINQDSLASFLQQYNTYGVGLCKTQQSLVDSIAAADSTASGCNVPPTALTCSSCLAGIGNYATYQYNYAGSIGITDTTQLTLTQKQDIRNQYVSDSSFCMAINTNTSHTLETIQRQMLADMLPYAGQYARDTGTVSMYSKYNIFATGGGTSYTQPFYKSPRNRAGQIDAYYDAFGRTDTTVTLAKLSTMTSADFEGAFANSWTNSLLAYHPEFSKLQYAQNNLQSSFNFIDSLNQTVSTAFSPIGSDPYFTLNATDKKTMTRYSDTTWQSGYSMWKMAYGDAFGCKVISDTGNQKTCYTNMPSQFTTTGTVVNTGAGGNVTLTTAMQLQAWNMYKGFYSQVRSDMVNLYIATHADSTYTKYPDVQNLITQGFHIYFPYSNVQQAQNSGMSAWYPTQSGTYPTVSLKDSTTLYSGHCSSYITAWQNALLQCPVLAGKDSVTLARILNSITGKMLAVCQNGTDGANPYGSSTVAPAYSGAAFTSFEQAVNFVMDSLGIPRDQYCNPYGITYPKPYGYNAVITRQQVSTLDTCTCSQFAKLKTEVTNAGYSISSLSSMNTYLWQTYHDTITTVLFQALQNCGQVYLENIRRDSLYNCRTVPHTPIGVVDISLDSAYVATGGNVAFTSTLNPDPHFTCAGGYTYQWQSSADGNTWTNISGATGSSYSTTFSTSKYIRLNATCSNGATYTSNTAYVKVSPTCYTYTARYDTLYALPLSSPQPLPQFLTCGFNGTAYSCYACSKFQSLDSSFFTIFGRHPVFTGVITNDTTIAYNSLFARYVNFKTGLQYSWMYYASQFNATGCAVGGIAGTGAGLSICLNNTVLTDTTGLLQPQTPCQQVRARATAKAALVYSALQQQVMANFQAAYLAQCLAAGETFKVTDTLKEYHYTLYYYDQAGNLIKTIPPKGVNPIYRQTWIDSVEAAKLNGTILVPVHSLATRYCYNSLNQVNIQKTPDGGVGKFYYDRLGRLTLSQNANQAGRGNTYSYTWYDSLGRITQVGQLTGGSAMTDTTAKNDANLQSWFTAATSTRNQITQTVYDTAYPAINGVVLSQQNLRNRVSFNQVVNNATDAYPAGATYYSYDIHGNVDTLLQDFGNSAGIANAMNQTGNRFKRIQYEYDLISGKVNRVVYQPTYFDVTQNAWLTPADQYYHRYLYDAENRVTDVYSGRDSVMLYLFPEREAHYTYYKHGPLARTDIGQLRVQGLDYAYTLQGWLKGVNPARGGTLANGTDTTEASPVAQDVYGFSLHYYNGDYKAIGYTPAGTSVLGGLGASAAPLYNGNIAAMGVNIPQLGATKVYNYHYDQLNRLVAMDTYNGLNGSAGTFTPVSINDYQERAAYDPNGNILTYQRNGDASRLSMDNLSYSYTAGTNRLHKVTDAAADASGGTYSQYNDIKQGQLDNNYKYDGIGNLVSDSTASITNISWTVYGKIKSITDSGKVINYTYDAAGNRILKATSADTTIYVRDATGNVLSIYEKKPGGNLVQTQVPVYGSSRLGMVTQHIAPDSALILTGGFGLGKKSIFTRGEKLFELSNHLGNVLVTVTDRRQQNSAGGVTVDSYAADIASASDYYPFGMLMPSRNYNAGNYRYGFNGQEKSDEIKGSGNSYTAEFWEYDPRIGRRWNIDPKPNQLGSFYATFNSNPIWFNDKLGDSSVIDNRGYIVHYDAKDKDLRVFMQQDGKLTLLGELGNKDKPIESSEWFKNLLADNSKESKGIWTINLWGFKNRVRQYGKWDYKYRSPANKDEDGIVNKMPSHILGIAFYRKDKENGVGDLPETMFTFDGNTGRAEDLNNYHFGVVGKAYNVFSEEFMLRTAGSIEMEKWAEDYKAGKRHTPQVPPSWRPIIAVHTYYGEHGLKLTHEIMGAPYGDNPTDHDFIKRGFKYYDAHKNELLGNQ